MLLTFLRLDTVQDGCIKYWLMGAFVHLAESLSKNSKMSLTYFLKDYEILQFTSIKMASLKETDTVKPYYNSGRIKRMVLKQTYFLNVITYYYQIMKLF